MPLISMNVHGVLSAEFAPIVTYKNSAYRDVTLHCADGTTMRQCWFADDSASLVIANTEAIAAAYQQGREDERNGVTRPV